MASSQTSDHDIEVAYFGRVVKFRHLRLVQVLARELSVRRTAEVLNTSQSAVSRGLAEIEALLSVKLFERTTRKMVATAFGRSLAWHAARILRDLALAEADFAALARGATQSLHVGLLRGFSAELLGTAVAAFQRRMPGVELRFEEGLADPLFQELSESRVELVLSHLDISHRHPDLETIRLYHERTVFVTRPGHPLQSQTRVGLDQLHAFNLVLPPTGTTLRANLDRMLRGLSGSTLSIVECVGIQFAASIIQATDSIAAVPQSACEWLASQGIDVCIVDMEESLAAWWVCAVRQRAAPRTLAETELIRCLQEASKSLDHVARNMESA
jgi:LysR family transcriptional regulator, pca operon transcriptional activator